MPIPFVRIQLNNFNSLTNGATDDRQPDEEGHESNGNTADNEDLKPNEELEESSNADNAQQALADGGNDKGGCLPKKRKVSHSKNEAIEKKKKHSKHAKADPVSSLVSDQASMPKIINTGGTVSIVCNFA